MGKRKGCGPAALLDEREVSRLLRDDILHRCDLRRARIDAHLSEDRHKDLAECIEVGLRRPHLEDLELVARAEADVVLATLWVRRTPRSRRIRPASCWTRPPAIGWRRSTCSR